MRLFGRSKKSKIRKHMKKMLSAAEKGKTLESLSVKTRHELITEIFTEQMHSLELQPSTDSGFIPVSYTPLSQMLSEYGIANDIISAILTGLQEADNEQSVRNIIEAAAETPDVRLSGDSLTKAQDLAVDEWKRLRET